MSGAISGLTIMKLLSFTAMASSYGPGHQDEYDEAGFTSNDLDLHRLTDDGLQAGATGGFDLEFHFNWKSGDAGCLASKARSLGPS